MAVYEMPVWERCPNLVAASDASIKDAELFDLRLKNPEKVDFKWLRLRLKAMENVSWLANQVELFLRFCLSL